MPPDDLDFRRLHYKSPEAYDRKWLEWFREEFASRMFRVDMELSRDVPFSLEGTTRILPELSVYTGACSPMRSQAVAGFVTDDTTGMTAALAGDMCMKVADKELELRPGVAAFGAIGARAVLDVRSPARVLSVSLSRRLLAPLLPNFSDLTSVSIRPDSQATRLLLRYLRMLDAEDTIDTPEARQLVTMHVHDLVALALGAPRDAGHVAEARGGRAARLAAGKADILANLHRSDLSVADVAARHEMTPRYVHMLFEGTGETCSGFIIAQRLARAHHMLTDPRLAGRTISAVAMDCGFGDLSHFNRTFRRRYGATPSDVREAGGNGG
jgi:AraC-like DNA-binding protein